MKNESDIKNWLLQATDDFKWLVENRQKSNFIMACIFAQQVGIKSFKALSRFQDEKASIKDSIGDAAKRFNHDDEIIEAGVFLDKFYISSKDNSYDPFEGINEEIAEKAYEYAKLIFETSKKIING